MSSVSPSPRLGVFSILCMGTKGVKVCRHGLMGQAWKKNVTFFNNSWTIFLVIEVQMKLGKVAHDVLGTGEQGV